MELSYNHAALRNFLKLDFRTRVFFYILLFAGLFCTALPVQSQWYLQSNPSGFNSIYDIQFTDSIIGWAVGENNTVIKTTDGGSNWIIQNPGLFTNRILFAVFPVNDLVVYAAGSKETIIKSIDGGITWLILNDTSQAGSSINYDVYFINPMTGWISSLAGRILSTADGGLSWDTAGLNTLSSLNQIQFSGPQTGWVAGESGLFRKSTNGGFNWLHIFPGTSADFSCNSMHFIDSNTGWLAGYRDVIYKTTDGGKIWDSLRLTSYSQSIRFADTLNGLCGGGEMITNEAIMCITHDGGYKWFRQNLPISSGFCSSIWMYSDSVAWAVFANRIIHTTNAGGPIGISANNESVPADFILHQNYPNPFNSSTVIEYEIITTGSYRLVVFNMLGQKVKELFNFKIEKGRHKLNFTPDNLASGVYYYSLIGNGNSYTKKLILVK